MKITNQTMREVMIKYPHSGLWNKDLSKWCQNDFNEFESLRKGEKKKKKPKWNPVNKVRVIRVSDGKPYDSIVQCKMANNLNNSQMHNFLKEGIKFKRL